jgi:hypothetical protein
MFTGNILLPIQLNTVVLKPNEGHGLLTGYRLQFACQEAVVSDHKVRNGG